MRKWLPMVLAITSVAYAICWRFAFSETMLTESYRTAIAQHNPPPAEATFVPVGEAMPAETRVVNDFGT